jgi:hypothetical protein
MQHDPWMLAAYDVLPSPMAPEHLSISPARATNRVS